ncbi:MAG: Hpt domain-containing protein [Deltaproteobacteria bacterium]|nr:Hpt domain-containing protein [Deltaproteobacteria bacterium]
MVEVLGMYIESTPSLLEQIREIDPAGVSGCAGTFHSIKGSSLNVGCRTVGDMAATLEKAAKEGDSEAVLKGCPGFIQTVEGLIWQMTSYLKHISPAD